MPKTVNVPELGVVSFPDEMSDEDINSAIQSHFNPEPVKVKLSPYEEAEYRYPGIGQSAMGPGTEFTTALTGAAITGSQKAQKVIGEAWQKGIEIPASSVLNALKKSTAAQVNLTTGQDIATPPIPTEPGVPMVHLPLAAPGEKGVIPELSRFAEGMTTPGSVLTLPLAPESRALRAFFAGQALLTIPESIQELATAKTDAEARGATTKILLQTGMAGLMAKGRKGKPDASKVEETAAVHGDVRTLEDAAKGVSTEESSGGIQPPAETQTTKVSLADDEAKYLEAERAGMDVPVEVTTPTSETEPFAGQVATIDRQKGAIQINPDEFSKWLKTVPEDRRAQAVKSMLNEERLHLATDDAAAQAYWQAITGLEQKIATRRYTGNWEGTHPQTGQVISPTLLAHEAVRYRMQQLSRMTPRELAESVGKEHWTIRGLDALEAVVRKSREILGTKASREQIAITDKILGNLSAIRDAMVDAAKPATIRKGTPEEASEEAKKIGFNFRESGAAKMEGVPEELRKQLESIYEATGWEFTHKDGNVTFYVPRGSSPEQIRERIASKSKEVAEGIARDLGIRYRGETTSPSTGRTWQFEFVTPEGGTGTAFRVPAFSTFEQVKDRFGARAEKFEPAAIRKAVDRSQELDQEIDRFLKTEAVDFYALNLLKDAKDPKAKIKTLLFDWYVLGKNSGFTPEEHQVLDHLILDQEKIANIFTDIINRRDEPGAIRKKKDGKQPELYLPPLPVRGAGEKSQAAELSGVPPQGATPTPSPAKKPSGVAPPAGLALTPGQPGEARPSATELGAKPITAAAIQNASYGHIQKQIDRIAAELAESPNTKPKAPSFAEFAKDIRLTFGTTMSDAALRDAWQQAIWQPLMNASGAKLEALREALSLKNRVGSRKIAEPKPGKEELTLTGEPVAGSTAAQRELLRSEAESQLAPESKKALANAQKYRRTVISAIGRKLSELGEETKAAYERSIVEPEEVAHGVESKKPAFNTISTEETKHPRALEETLTADARQYGSPVSATKRLTVLQNRTTGRVEMVSTFKDPRRGAVLLDPDSPSKTHGKLDSIMKRYRPVFSVLIRDPVQSFRQSFESLSQFEDQFGTKARPSGVFDEPLPVEGEFTQSPSGGRYATPGAFQSKPGLLEQGEDVSLASGEARAIIDHIFNESASLEGPEDIKASWNALIDRPNYGVINGYRKIGKEIERTNPNLSVEEILDRIADQIYEAHRYAKDYEDFIAKTVALGGPQASKAFSIERQRQAAHVQEPSGQELTMPIERIPPTVVRPEQVPPGSIPPRRPAPPVPEGSLQRATSPAALRKVKERAKEEIGIAASALSAAMKRRDVQQQIPMRIEGQSNAASVYALEAGNSIRLASGDKLEPTDKTKPARQEALKRREAALAMQASGFEKETKSGGKVWIPNPKELDFFDTLIAQGRGKASVMARSLNPVARRTARRWEKALDHYKEIVQYAREHWKDPKLRETVKAYQTEMKDALDLENAHGSDVTERDNYIPGRYEGEFWGDNVITFAGKRLLGTQYRFPKKFRSPFHAIADGPYILASTDIAALAEHRIRQGQRIVAQKTWLNSLKHLKDPDSGQPIAKEPVWQPIDKVDPETGEVRTIGKWKAPSLEYVLVPTSFGINDKPIAVRVAFEPTVRSTVAPSRVTEMTVGPWPVFKDALIATSMLKHGWWLMWDSFHPGRLGQYTMGLLGIKGAGYNGGFSALQYRPEHLQKAVEQRYISQAAADWALGTVEVNVPKTTRTASGTTTTVNKVRVTRQDLARQMISNGLNAAKISDALYKDAVQNIPFIGEAYHKVISPYNRWLFDRFVPGVVIESAVRKMEEFSKRYPNVEFGVLMRDVIRDINRIYGNMGKQGIFRNATVRDIAQIFMLAPLWQEGIFSKELTTLSRATGLSYALGRRKELPYLGVTGEWMMKGLGTYFALAQVLNLITRQKFTWQNEEEGHKMDAWLPIGDRGIWLSPLSVFAEVTHDLIRLSETKRKTWDILLQMGENRLGPVGRLESILRTGRSPMGEQYSTTAGVFKGALKGFLGSPITFSGPARELGHAIAPHMISPNPPGQLARQLVGSLTGTKVEVGKTPASQMQQLADHFTEKEGLKKSTGWVQTMTDEPSYSKLASALRNGDGKAAKEVFEELRKNHTEEEIIKAMRVRARRGFAGSKKNETLFRQSLNDKQLEIYTRAMEQKQAELQMFYDFLLSQPGE